MRFVLEVRQWEGRCSFQLDQRRQVDVVVVGIEVAVGKFAVAGKLPVGYMQEAQMSWKTGTRCHLCSFSAFVRRKSAWAP